MTETTEAREEIERNWNEIVKGPFDEILRHTGDWRRGKGFDTGWHNFGEKLMLVVTEIDEARQARMKIHQCLDYIENGDFEAVLAGLADMQPALANYLEEWAGTLVRIFDMCEACGLRPGIEVGVVIEEEVDAGLMDMIVDKGAEREGQCVHCLSEAMEAFRHVTFVNAVHGEREMVPQSSPHLDLTRACIFRAVDVAQAAIDSIGYDWRNAYATEMIKNEGRKHKHGKER